MSLMLSSKFLLDADNQIVPQCYAQLLGITRAELMKMEIKMLALLEFNVFISEEEYYAYKAKL